ncbi:MAG: toll/interleukin-1 receptor domain-containing protein, partial [Planctomycetaceae bacterium]|nr:toll/interleukin-1 receptor domain-containing protein [Planctomycetaceae bacterium]
MAIESSTPWVEPYDLFVSYSRKDDADGMVSALVAQIQAEHAEFSPTFPLKLFFDCQSIVTGDYWRETLRKGLRQSKVLLAVLSPHYFASEYCRWEWEEFLRIEQSRTIPGEALMPLFIVAPADLEGQVTPATREWWDSLAKIHGVEIHPFWPRGREVLRDNEVRERVRGLAQRAAERADLGRRLSAVPRSELERNPNFVGRVSELRQLREALTNFEIVGVCAVHGIGGIGKTSLAVEYAYCFRPEYLGGLFKLDLSTTHSVADLQSQLVTLAETKLHAAIDHGAPLERQFAAARSAFEQGNIHDQILLILDNLNEEDAALVSAGARGQWILNLEKVHIVVTTRLGPKGLGLQECISVDRLSAAEALDVLFQYRAFGRNPADPDYLAARAADERWEVYAGSHEPAAAEPHDDDEWKAALAIANRLGRHTLMVAQVGAYLGNYDIPYGTFLAEMDPAGIGLALDDVGSDAAVQQLIAHPQPTIEALLSRSLDRLAASSPLPQRILEYAAFLPPDHIPVRWLELLVRADAEMAAPLSVRKIGRDPWRDALGELADLQHLTGSESRRMHRILQEAVQRRLSPKAAALRSAQVTEMLDTVAVQLQGSHLPPQVVPEVAALRACVWPNLDGDDVLYGRVALALTRLLLRRGNLRDAIRCGEAAARLLALRSKQAPENADYARDLSVSYERMGDLFRALGDGTRAREYYEQALTVRQRLAEQAPENADYARDLSVSYNRMGDLFRALGDGTRAREYYEQDLKIAQRLAEQAPENADY